MSNKIAPKILIIPAEAGIYTLTLDSRLRENDRLGCQKHFCHLGCRVNGGWRIAWSFLAILSLVVLACAPKEAPAVPQARKNPESVDLSLPKSGWEARWEEILKAARKEGTVVLYGPPVVEVRIGFIENFQNLTRESNWNIPAWEVERPLQS